LDKIYGKYRGKVTDNRDDQNLGRIRAELESILGGKETGWALPSSPYSGNNVGFLFIPPVGAMVWIEFEGGDPDIPIWSGCFWNKGEIPKQGILPYSKILKTEFATLIFNDAPNSPEEIKIRTKTGLQITMNSTKIEISTNISAKIVLDGKDVSINDGALEVM
jgi:uncharacterized protein involved in type VI secretion and phage assembly